MKNIFVVGFVLMVLAQWYAPLSMIYDSQKTIIHGTEYKFKTAPVDPTDPFRGKYITLAYDAERFRQKDTIPSQPGPAYGLLDVDSAGFARIVSLQYNVPERADFIQVQVDYSYDSVTFLSFPFKRFYLEESKASEAEQVYWRSRGDSSTVCYAKVMVLHGDAKLTDVIINDSSIVDVVRRINEGKRN